MIDRKRMHIAEESCKYIKDEENRYNYQYYQYKKGEAYDMKLFIALLIFSIIPLIIIMGMTIHV